LEYEGSDSEFVLGRVDAKKAATAIATPPSLKTLLHFLIHLAFTSGMITLRHAVVVVSKVAEIVTVLTLR
jgi:hypothetical protein